MGFIVQVFFFSLLVVLSLSERNSVFYMCVSYCHSCITSNFCKFIKKVLYKRNVIYKVIPIRYFSDTKF